MTWRIATRRSGLAQAQDTRPGEGPRSSAKRFWPSLGPRWNGLLDRAAARWHAAPQAEATLIDASCLARPPPLWNQAGLWSRGA